METNKVIKLMGENLQLMIEMGNIGMLSERGMRQIFMIQSNDYHKTFKENTDYISKE